MVFSTSWCPRGSCSTLRLVVSALLLASASLAQKDPITDFCRRFGHQTAIIDDKLYIDGGKVNWNPMNRNKGNSTNTWLLWQDLKHNADVGMPQIYANLSKNASVPSVHGGYLWADETNKYLFLFGGSYLTSTPPAIFQLYAYDVINDYWLEWGRPPPEDFNSVSYGAGTSVSARGEGYYYGGWVSTSTVPSWGGSPPLATTGLIKYDMDTGAWSLIAGPDNVRRAEGSMVFIPAGDGGLLVYMGGITAQHGYGNETGQSLDTIFLYDVLSSKWYTQTATGTIPGDRRRFCAGATWAPDHSSYNIYIYGGAGFKPNTAGYDDLYVLTMPAFEWIRLYPDDATGNKTGAYPHHSLTCNVYSGAQMLIVGGTFPLSDDCDVPQQWGTHNADLTTSFGGDPAPWKLFADNETKYAVPAAVVSAVGGSPSGKATKTAPSGGWDSDDLRVLMTRTATIAKRTATRVVSTSTAAPSTKLGAGALAGISVGSVAAGVLLAAGGWVCVRRFRARRGGVAGGAGGPAPFGFGGPQHMYEGSGAGALMVYPPQRGYSDAPSPPGGTDSPHNTGWSPPQGSPFSSASPYYHGAGGSGYMAAPQHPPPAELAASSGSGYVHLTPVGMPAEASSNSNSNASSGKVTGTGVGTGTGTGTGSSGTHDTVLGTGGPGSGSVWTQQVSDMQVRSPKTEAHELQAGIDAPVQPSQQHTTYYHK